MLASYISTWYKPCWKQEPQLIQCIHRIGLWPSIRWYIFLVDNVGGPSSLLGVPLLGWWLWVLLSKSWGAKPVSPVPPWFLPLGSYPACVLALTPFGARMVTWKCNQTLPFQVASGHGVILEQQKSSPRQPAPKVTPVWGGGIHVQLLQGQQNRRFPPRHWV